MNHAAGMGIHEGLGSAFDDFKASSEWKGRGRSRVATSDALENLEKVLAGDPLHREVKPFPVVSADLVDRHGIGMLELGGHPGHHAGSRRFSFSSFRNSGRSVFMTTVRPVI